MTALASLLPPDAALCLEPVTAFCRRELTPHAVGWDAADAGAAAPARERLEDLGVTDVLSLEELGSEKERRAVLLAVGEVVGQADAGLAMACLTLAHTGDLLARPVGFAREVVRPDGVGAVALTAGRQELLLLDGRRRGRLVTLPVPNARTTPAGAASSEPLLGLRLGGGHVFRDTLPATEAAAIPTEKMAALVCRLELAALAVAIGCARGSLVTARTYAAERVQGGCPIDRHYAVRKMLDAMEERVARAGILLAFAAGDPAANVRRACCRDAFDACERAVSDGVQVLGGYGYMQEYGQEKRMRDVKTLRLLLEQPVRSVSPTNEVVSR